MPPDSSAVFLRGARTAPLAQISDVPPATILTATGLRTLPCPVCRSVTLHMLQQPPRCLHFNIHIFTPLVLSCGARSFHAALLPSHTHRIHSRCTSIACRPSPAPELALCPTAASPLTCRLFQACPPKYNRDTKTPFDEGAVRRGGAWLSAASAASAPTLAPARASPHSPTFAPSTPCGASRARSCLRGRAAWPRPRCWTGRSGH